MDPHEIRTWMMFYLIMNEVKRMKAKNELMRRLSKKSKSEEIVQTDSDNTAGLI